MKKQVVGPFLGLIAALFIFPACEHGRQQVVTEDLGMGGLPGGSTGSSVSVTPPQMVSVVKEVIAKNADGNVVRKVVFDFSEEGVLSKATEEKFNAAGAVTDRTEWNFSPGGSSDAGTVINADIEALSGLNATYSFTLDGSGRIAHLTVLTEGTFEGAPQTELSFEYLGNGLRPSGAALQFLSEGGVVGGYTSEYEYNAQGYLKKIEQENNLPPGPAVQIEQKFEYDSRGLANRIEKWRGGAMLLRSDFQNLVAPDGRLAQIRSGDVVKTFSYDASGNIKGYCVEGVITPEKCLEFNYASFLNRPQLFQILPQPKREAIEKLPASFPDVLYQIVEVPAAPAP